MALYRVHLIGLYTGHGQPDDFTSMSWGVEAAGVPDPAALQAAWVAAKLLPTASTGWGGMMSSQWGTYAWEVRPAAGGATAAYSEVARSVGTVSSAGPASLALAVQSVVAAGVRTRRTGRWMMGPLGIAAFPVRPAAAWITQTLGVATRWHASLTSLGYQPRALVDGGTVGLPILGYSCGNAWGHVRSRQGEVTARSTVII